jgi:hypothetical protein
LLPPRRLRWTSRTSQAQSEVCRSRSGIWQIVKAVKADRVDPAVDKAAPAAAKVAPAAARVAAAVGAARVVVRVARVVDRAGASAAGKADPVAGREARAAGKAGPVAGKGVGEDKVS